MPTAEQPLMILALDHRDSFEKSLFHVDPQAPGEEALASMRRVKSLVYQGLLQARADLDAGIPGVLVDEDLGADVQHRAKADGVVLAIPVEKSGETVFDLEYGEHTEEKVGLIDPDYVKVLVRMNPDDDPEATATQLRRLGELSSWLHSIDKPFLYELLVPASDRQLAEVGGDKDAYDRNVRPGLVVEVIRANQAAGVEPQLWKIEGLETADAAREVVAACRAGGRADVGCIVLGRDAPQDRLDHWLRVAAPVEGFVGFAIGRSIWEDGVEQFLRSGDEDALVRDVAHRYSHFARTYLDAAGAQAS